jgi:putative transposase
VYARGNDRRPIYLDDTDRRNYLSMLGRVCRRKRWRGLAYCLMDNHVHLLLETPEANLGAGMQRLHSLYAQTFNERHRRSGHVFQGRYGAVRMLSDEQLWTAVAYIVRNPVDAGLCERPGEWPWSSHAATLGRSSQDWLDVERLLGHLGESDDVRSRYAELTMGAAGVEPATSRV